MENLALKALQEMRELIRTRPGLEIADPYKKIVLCTLKDLPLPGYVQIGQQCGGCGRAGVVGCNIRHSWDCSKA